MSPRARAPCDECPNFIPVDMNCLNDDVISDSPTQYVADTKSEKTIYPRYSIRSHAYAYNAGRYASHIVKFESELGKLRIPLRWRGSIKERRPGGGYEFMACEHACMSRFKMQIVWVSVFTCPAERRHLHRHKEPSRCVQLWSIELTVQLGISIIPRT